MDLLYELFLLTHVAAIDFSQAGIDVNVYSYGFIGVVDFVDIQVLGAVRAEKVAYLILFVLLLVFIPDLLEIVQLAWRHAYTYISARCVLCEYPQVKITQ